MDYLEINKSYWNSRVKSHMESDFYGLEDFIGGKSSLKFIELEHLPQELKGKKVLHLQCHFGQDTLSLARMGAEVTGLDLSNEAITQAKLLANKLEVNAEFVESDVYAAKENLTGIFDFIFTSYGTIGWLPDLDRWADIISHFLRPGGEFLIVDFHPVVWMFDDDFSEIKYSYFNKGKIVGETEGTYTDKGAELKEEFIGWNHHLGEVFTALNRYGLSIKSFKEYDTSPWPCFNHQVTVENGFQIEGLEGKIPMVYALLCRKND